MMSGPSLEVVKMADYRKKLEDEKIEAWYHNPRIYAWLRKHRLQALDGLVYMLAPRGYARPDNLDGPTEGDHIVLREDVVQACQDAIKQWRAEGKISRSIWRKMNVAPHEFSHCLVDWTPTKEQEEKFDHPGKALPAIAHAHRTGYRINAFTGLLRWAVEPEEDVWVPFIAWFEATMELRTL